MKTAQIPQPAPRDQRPGRFAHILLQTPRYTDMVPWYKKLLSASAMFENDAATFLTYDEEHHRVVILNSPEAAEKDPKAAGVGHFAFAFDCLGDLLNNFLSLKQQHDLTPKYCVNHGFMTSFYYIDPDGNEVELGVDNFAHANDINAWFNTGAFDKNFFGFFCDPEQMLELHQQGVPDAEVFSQTYQ